VWFPGPPEFWGGSILIFGGCPCGATVWPFKKTKFSVCRIPKTRRGPYRPALVSQIICTPKKTIWIQVSVLFGFAGCRVWIVPQIFLVSQCFELFHGCTLVCLVRGVRNHGFCVFSSEIRRACFFSEKSDEILTPTYGNRTESGKGLRCADFLTDYNPHFLDFGPSHIFLSYFWYTLLPQRATAAECRSPALPSRQCTAVKGRAIAAT
jgi:hypothetical protein